MTNQIMSLEGKSRQRWVWDLLLVVVLFAGAFFRFTGLRWDEYTHMHPDERFLTMVETSLQPVRSLASYFDTDHSTLNPHNRGYGFFVYGTLPIFIVRYVGEWFGETGYDQIYIVGRQLSALADLLTVLLVYLIANRLFHRPALGVLAAAFSAFSVLPIQQSHYFTVDTFTNFFGFVAFYFAVLLLPNGNMLAENRAAAEAEAREKVEPPGDEAEAEAEANDLYDRLFEGVGKHWISIIPYVLFGAALGMAMASKINAVALAVLLPGAVFIRWLSLPPRERERWALVYLRNLAIAGLVSVVVFRICQPYAFEGPGFFNFSLNEKWVANIKDQRAQAAGDVDFPPALQWARRPIWFALQNLTLWGLGLPLGILAWVGFVWMGWRILLGEWRQCALLWGWTAFYVAWQATQWNPTMRYLLLIYPTMAILAAWAVFALWDHRPLALPRVNWRRVLAVVIGGGVLAATFAWALAFLQIYIRPFTRAEASRWIYQNIPGPINLKIDTGDGVINQPLAFQSGYKLRRDTPVVIAFVPREDGEIFQATFEHLGGSQVNPSLKTLTLTVSQTPQEDGALTGGWIMEYFRPEDDPRGNRYTIPFSRPVPLNAGQTYYLILTLQSDGDRLTFSGPVTVSMFTPEGSVQQWLPEPVGALKAGESFSLIFTPVVDGTVSEVVLPRAVDWEANPEIKTLRLKIINKVGIDEVLITADLQADFLPSVDVRGETYTIKLPTPVQLSSEQPYTLLLELVDGPGRLALYGSKQVVETSWDDALPAGMSVYNPYDYSVGIYRSDLNFEMYWEDNEEKLTRFLTNLDQADYIFISSNRQWGTTVRLPERYPLTTEYYRQLLGCPIDREIIWCYSVAQPGMFQGNLGYELAAVFQSDPGLGSFRINTQFAEEAFSVYDHPKVLIFRKTAAYDSKQVAAILGAVDLSKVIHLTPRSASTYPGTLMLPEDRLEEQREGGTWAELFDTNALINRYPALTVVVWYLVVALLGWVVYPFVRLALHALPDRGYPLARLAGLMLLAYPVWVAGSYKIPFTPTTISAVFAGLVVINLVLAVVQRKALARELRERGKYFLTIELLFLAFFTLFLLVRLGNPDLWHPYKGGEKPMDFSYLNAVLKSTTFPPYDPWFAGGYINYYYYGFVLVGVPVKWLGIVPAAAYNLILPTLFGMLALGAFSIGWNLVQCTQPRRKLQATLAGGGAFWAGLAAALGTVVLGNLGTVRMVWHGLQRLAPMQVPFEEASFPLRIVWTVQGLVNVFKGAKLPYGPGDWYWIPSRAIPGEPITEFPAFTFLYADLHAHMIALPVTLLALSWALSVLLGRWGWKGFWHLAASFFLGALAIGALRPINTWDWPTYLALGSISVVYTALRYGDACCLQLPVSRWVKRGLIAGVGVVALVLLSSVLFAPYSQWYGQGYNAIDTWDGARTPFWSYLTHWGLFLFVIITWMALETLDWMASTPVSALRKLRGHHWVLVQLAVVALFAALVVLTIMKVGIAWLVLPAAAWAGILLFRPGMPDAKRAVLFLIGTALVLTLFVEVKVLRGDIGRMNTVFKFYLQAWVLLGLSAGASLWWILRAPLRVWSEGMRFNWQTALTVLVFGAALFPLMAGMDKIRDRMAQDAPHTLDGMTYMAYSTYPEGETDMDLRQDYEAIRWMQENIEGSPVIVEGHTPEYRWGTRYTIYTGLPGVVGWNWHQRQQRAVTPDTWVFERVSAVNEFYNTNDPDEARAFLNKYDVRYIVVGQLERAMYTRMGIAKFDLFNGDLWQEVYRNGDTVIYEVLTVSEAQSRR